MQFRFTNTLVIFQRRINYILGEYLNNFIIAYLDDIIIYLNSVEEHKEHIKWVLRKLYKENILVAVKKYKFYTKKTNFVGFIIKLGQISMDPKKIKAIVNW
jgi:ribosome-interacting GTPase 1